MSNRFDLLSGLSGDKMQGRNYPDVPKDSLLEPTTYMSPQLVTMYILSHFVNDLPHKPYMRQLSDLWKINVELPNLFAAVSEYEFQNHDGRWREDIFTQEHSQKPAAQSVPNIDLSHISNLDLSEVRFSNFHHWHRNWPPIQSGYERGLSKPKDPAEGI